MNEWEGRREEERKGKLPGIDILMAPETKVLIYLKISLQRKHYTACYC